MVVEQPVFNPFDPAFAADPYPTLADFREQEPVHFSPIGTWILFRYDDVLRVLRDPTLSVEDAKADIPPALQNAEREELTGNRSSGSRAMLNLDPPDHHRLRRLVAKVFTPRVVENLRPVAQQLVDDLLHDALARDAHVLDIIGDVAFPLPFAVISDLLGMPEGQDRVQLRTWSGDLVKTLDPVLTDEEFVTALAAGDAMTAYVREVLVWKRAHPADDLLSALLAAEDEGDRLTEQELIDQVLLLFVAGHETTVNLIGNGMLALMRNRAELERLADDPTLDVNAIDELLRYDGPVTASRRITLVDVEIGGRTIPARSFVLTSLASANRDVEHFGPTAGTLDLGRPNAGEHVAFGGGFHHCLGAALARLEGQVAIGSLVRRFPDIELTGEPLVYNGRVVLRGLTRLPVALAHAHRS
ncbi:MAG TPA: cytochrome P450 [Acidimicrobiia bacterium]|jgi:cytochrome P450|nr:cytochrome P450 [Acidimicrobiia bacterium]